MHKFPLICSTLTLLLPARLAQATPLITPLSSNLTVTASGHATVPIVYGGQSQSYNLSKNYAGVYSTLSDSVSGEATANITIVEPGLLYGTVLHAVSSASGSFAISDNTVTLAARMSADGDPYSLGSLSSFALTSVTVNFEVTQPIMFSLTGTSVFGVLDYPSASGIFSLALSPSDGGGAIANFNSSGLYYSPLISLNGFLAPGSYTLSTTMAGPGVVSALGDGTFGNESITFAAIAVADDGGTLGLSALAVAAVMLIRCHLPGAGGRPTRRKFLAPSFRELC